MEHKHGNTAAEKLLLLKPRDSMMGKGCTIVPDIGDWAWVGAMLVSSARRVSLDKGTEILSPNNLSFRPCARQEGKRQRS